MSKKSKVNKKSNETETTPCPTIGECWHFIIDSLDLSGVLFEDKEKKTFEKFLERLVKEKDIDLERGNEVEIRVIQALKKVISDEQLADLLSCFMLECVAEYRAITLEYETCLERKETVKWLIDTRISSIVLCLKRVQFRYRSGITVFPDDPYWFLPVKQAENEIIWPIERVIDWWIELAPIENRKRLSEVISDNLKFEGYEEQNRVYEKNMYRWRKNENLPRLSGLMEISKVSFGIEDEERLKRSLVFNLVIARAIQSVFAKLNATYGEEITFGWISRFKASGELFDKSEGKKLTERKERLHNVSDKDWDISLNGYFGRLNNKITMLTGEIQSIAVQKSGEECVRLLDKKQDVLIRQYGDFVVNAVRSWYESELSFDDNFSKFINIVPELLNKLVGLEFQKQPGDKDRAKELIQELETLEPYNRRLSYYIFWNRARWYVLMNQPEQAVKFYEKAFESAKYRAGNRLKNIIRESVLVAAHLRKKELFKSMYKWALYYGLFSEPFNEVEDWLMDKHAQQFKTIFSPAVYYPEAVVKKDSLSLQGIIYTPDWETRKLDLRYPDREIKGYGPIPLTQLMIYSTLGDVGKVKKLIEKGADPNKRASDNSTALISAISAGGSFDIPDKQREIINLILKQDVSESINARTNRGKQNAMSIAVYKADPEMVQKLIEKGADVNLKATVDDLPPLYYAVTLLKPFDPDKSVFDDPNFDLSRMARGTAPLPIGDRVPVLDEDYAREVSITDDDPRDREIHKIVRDRFYDIQVKKRENYLNIVEILINYPETDLNVKATNGFTALILASEIGEFEVVQKLIRKGADVNAKGDGNANALALALFYGHPQIAEWLFDQSDVSKDTINLSLLNDDYLCHTSLKFAIHRGYVGIVEKLIKKGADINQQFDMTWPTGMTEKITPLFLAAWLLGSKTIRTEILGIVNGLIDCPEVNLDFQNGDRLTSMMLASKYGELDVVKKLIERGADTEKEGKNGETAFEFALDSGHEEIAELLLKMDASIGRSGIIISHPKLNLAIEKGYGELVKKFFTTS